MTHTPKGPMRKQKPIPYIKAKDARGREERGLWLRKGNAHAQSLLGLCYAKGEGVPKNMVEALAWYNLAAVSGEEKIAEFRDRMEQRLGREATLQAQQRAKELLKIIKKP